MGITRRPGGISGVFPLTLILSPRGEEILHHWGAPHKRPFPIKFLFFLFTALEDGCPIKTVGHDEGTNMDARYTMSDMTRMFSVDDSNNFHLRRLRRAATYRTATQDEKKCNKSLRKYFQAGSIIVHATQNTKETKWIPGLGE